MHLVFTPYKTLDTEVSAVESELLVAVLHAEHCKFKITDVNFFTSVIMLAMLLDSSTEQRISTSIISTIYVT